MLILELGLWCEFITVSVLFSRHVVVWGILWYCVNHEGIEEDFVAWWKELKARLLPVLNGSSPISSLDGPQLHQPAQDSVRERNCMEACHVFLIPTVAAQHTLTR